MAGRGVDIKLGGKLDNEVLAQVNDFLEQNGVESPHELSSEEANLLLEDLRKETQISEKETREAIKKFREHFTENTKVKKLGGLHVIGDGLNQSARVILQLKGRAARQGDPGSSKTYLSPEDDVVKKFAGEKAERFSKVLAEEAKKQGVDLDQPAGIEKIMDIEGDDLDYLFEFFQEVIDKIERDTALSRMMLMEYDRVDNKQRAAFYKFREKANDFFEGEDKDTALGIIDLLWRNHLSNLAGLRILTGLSGYGQVDPLAFYQSNASDLFTEFANQAKKLFPVKNS